MRSSFLPRTQCSRRSSNYVSHAGCRHRAAAKAGASVGKLKRLFFAVCLPNFCPYYPRTSVKGIILAIMDEEDDTPPMLVAAEGSSDPAEATLSADMEDVKITKVPITIITGRCLTIILSRAPATSAQRRYLAVLCICTYAEPSSQEHSQTKSLAFFLPNYISNLE